MNGILVEAVIVSFCVGGVIGAVIAMQLLLHVPGKKTETSIDR